MAAPSSPAATADAAVNSNNNNDVTRPTKRLKPREENEEQNVISSSPNASSHCSVDIYNSSSSSLLDNNSSTVANSSDGIFSNDCKPVRPPVSIIDLCISRLFHPLPQTLLATHTPNNNNTDKVTSFRSQWINHGFRTTIVSSPRSAVSVYLDSCGGTPSESSAQEHSTG